MIYDKGPQLTVGNLKQYLHSIPDDVKVRINMGDKSEEMHYLLNEGGELVLCVDCYMQDAYKTNLLTVLSFNKK